MSTENTIYRVCQHGNPFHWDFPTMTEAILYQQSKLQPNDWKIDLLSHAVAASDSLGMALKGQEMASDAETASAKRACDDAIRLENEMERDLVNAIAYGKHFDAFLKKVLGP